MIQTAVGFVGQVGNLRRVVNPPADLQSGSRMPVGAQCKRRQAECHSAAGCHPAPQSHPFITLLVIFLPLLLHAETGRSAWLRYAALSDTASRPYLASLPASVTTFGESPVIESARRELTSGIRQQLGRTLRQESRLPAESSFVLGTLADLRQFHLDANLDPDAFWLTTAIANGVTYTVVTASNGRGVLYGVFALLRKIALGEPIANLNERQSPYAPVRWVNQWDNLDGSIERGYGGRSIFWDDGHARDDLTRVAEYARLLASLGINACCHQ